MKNFLVVSILLTLVVTSGISFAFAQEDIDQVLHNVAAEYDQRGVGFDVHYLLNGTLSSDVIINPDERKITFTIETEVKEQDEWLGLILHEDLLYLPIRAFVDGVQEPDSIVSAIGETSTLYVPLKPGAKEIQVEGVAVIPEFGSIATLILVISIISIIILTSTKKSPILWLR